MREDAREREARRRPVAKSRSHAAIPVALVLVVVGLVLGGYTLFAPLVIGLLLLVSGFSLFSSRINPLSAHFYSDRKASWAAVGVVFLSALVLLWYAYELWTSHYGWLKLPAP